MIAGDKDDLERYQGKNVSPSNLVDSSVDCNLTEFADNPNDQIHTEGPSSLYTDQPFKLITDIEAGVSEVLKDLIKLRTKNEDLQLLIEKSRLYFMKDELTKTDGSSLNYFDNFDKYFMYSTNVLSKTVNKLADNYNEQKTTEQLLIEVTDTFQSSLDLTSVKMNKASLNCGSFVSFLKINRIHDLVDQMMAIGHGGEGRVFRAILKATNEPVVVKSYFMDCEQSSRIEYAMLVLCHNVKGVKKPIGLFQTNSNYYLVMEDDHKSIPLDVLAEKGILTENQIQNLFSQMVYILYELRNKFIKHRDVKLDNFLLNTDTGRLSIIDFGWAMYTALDHVLIEEVKRSGETLMGTFDYLPPEAESAPGTVVSYDKATVYSLGCILLELFFGYQGKIRNILSKESLLDFVNRLSISKSRPISKGAFSILDRCLKHSIRDRFGLDDIILHPWVPSDKIDNSIFRNFNKTSNISNIMPTTSNTSLPCNSNRHFSVGSH